VPWVSAITPRESDSLLPVLIVSIVFVVLLMSPNVIESANVGNLNSSEA
jgi:hypothetical protein